MHRFYPSEIRRIADYCDALDRVDAEIGDHCCDLPMLPPVIPLVSSSQDEWGALTDHDGIGWAWEPPTEDDVLSRRVREHIKTPVNLTNVTVESRMDQPDRVTADFVTGGAQYLQR